jgi:hypothetical protein
MASDLESMAAGSLLASLFVEWLLSFYNREATRIISSAVLNISDILSFRRSQNAIT